MNTGHGGEPCQACAQALGVVEKTFRDTAQESPEAFEFLAIATALECMRGATTAATRHAFLNMADTLELVCRIALELHETSPLTPAFLRFVLDMQVNVKAYRAARAEP